MENLQNILKHHVIEATKKIEEHVDSQIERLENLDLDDLKNLREKRLRELKKEEQEKREWLNLGHGDYTELSEEKQFFEIAKKSTNIVCIFFKSGSPRCAILDHHIKILCMKHLEARFVKMNVERSPFLVDRLKIRTIPTVGIFKDGRAVDYIIGFTELGNCDDFSTEILEWRLAQSGVIKYSGDLSTPPDQQKLSKKPFLQEKRKNIRGSSRGDSSDDEFLND